jgi:hypothetical protein
MKRFVYALVALSLAACATTQHGPMQEITVDSEPSGALVELHGCGVFATDFAKTPATVVVSRRSTQCTLELTKLGYKPVRVKLSRHVAEEFVDNANVVAATACVGDCEVALAITAAGLVLAGTGMAVDGVTGSMFELAPHHVDAVLCPSDQSCASLQPQRARLTDR